MPSERRIVNRWSAWARALSSKHKRSARRAAAGMTLVRQPKPWWDFRVALALRPVVARETRQLLRSAVHETTATVLRQPNTTQVSPSPQPVARVPFIAAPVRFVPVKAVAAFTREVRIEKTSSKTTERSRSGGVLTERLFERLVLARSRKEGAADQAGVARAAGAPAGRVRSAAKRFEETRPAPMHLVTRKSAEPAGERRRFSMDGAEPPAREARTAPAAPLDVDAISSRVINEIDRRLVAYRERMGRV